MTTRFLTDSRFLRVPLTGLLLMLGLDVSKLRSHDSKPDTSSGKVAPALCLIVSPATEAGANGAEDKTRKIEYLKRPEMSTPGYTDRVKDKNARGVVA